MELLAATALAFGAVFVAEFGDKSQLLILAFATRHPWQPVVIGLIMAAATIQGVSVAIGATLGAALPATAVAVVSSIAFLAVAAWTLRGEDDDDTEAADDARARRLAGIGLVLAVAAAFVLSELGDKTMLTTFALAAMQGPLPTWIGSTAGEVAANLVAVTVGRGVGRRLSPRSVRIGSAALFALAGFVILAGALVGQG